MLQSPIGGVGGWARKLGEDRSATYPPRLENP